MLHRWSIPTDQFACLRFIGCFWKAKTSLSSDFKKLPVFAETYLVNVSQRQNLLILFSMPKKRSRERSRRPMTCVLLSTRRGWVVKQYSIAYSKYARRASIDGGTTVSWNQFRTWFSRKSWMPWTNEGQTLHMSSTVPLKGAVMAIHPLESYSNIAFTHT